MADKDRTHETLALDLDNVADVWLGGTVSKELLRLEIKRGHLVPTRVGRRLLVTRTELERYLAANQEA